MNNCNISLTPNISLSHHHIYLTHPFLQHNTIRGLPSSWGTRCNMGCRKGELERGTAEGWNPWGGGGVHPNNLIYSHWLTTLCLIVLKYRNILSWFIVFRSLQLRCDLSGFPANTNVFLTLAQGCGLVIFCFDVARTFLDRFYILVTIRVSERSENDRLYIKNITN